MSPIHPWLRRVARPRSSPSAGASLRAIIVLILAGCIAVVGCTDAPHAPEQGAQPIISDAIHGPSEGRVAGFYFLPPVVPRPTPRGDFVPDVAPTVQIDRLDPATGASQRTIATFTRTRGDDGAVIRVRRQGERREDDDEGAIEDPNGYFWVRWRTRPYHLSTNALYRIRVLVPGGRELGFADLRVVDRERDGRAIDRNEFVALRRDHDLLIRFRIDRPAVDADGDSVFDWDDDCPTVANTNQRDSLGNGVGDACRCRSVTCAAPDACHIAGTCDPTTGLCSNPAAPEETACGTDRLCRAGVCVEQTPRDAGADVSEEPPTCPTGRLACGSACVDSQTDSSHCGRCDNACGGGQVCRRGICGRACHGDEVDCGDVCSTLRDNNNCGGCGIACARGATCWDGACQCLGVVDIGRVLPSPCGGVCTDTWYDRLNCGTCGHVCAAGLVCIGGTCSPWCLPGFTNCGGVCAALNQDASHCGSCDNACPGGARCVSGVCTCPTGTVLCEGTCVDPSSDRAHCAGCGNACTAGNVCVAGACVPCRVGTTFCDVRCEYTAYDDPNHCGGCDIVCAPGQVCVTGSCACPAGTVLCDGRCVDSQLDPANCGGCAHACPAGQVCAAGQCGACPEGLSLCGGRCVDLQRDSENCGRCGDFCRADFPVGGCIAGECRCLFGGTTLCGGVCLASTSLLSDNFNCGVCGVACGRSQTCQGGACVDCPAGQTVCSFACTNLRNDPRNCGACGNACPSFNRCVDGACAPGWSAGLSWCFFQARDIQNDVSNCGGCAHACAPGLMCIEGVCRCGPGQTDCGGSCFDLRDDVHHCGACGTQCADGIPCIGGVCASCPAGQTACAGACVDTQSDSNNCRVCGGRCVNGSICAGGACVCPPGASICAGFCVDTTRDATNCGGCGVACTAIDGGVGACVSGRCAL